MKNIVYTSNNDRKRQRERETDTELERVSHEYRRQMSGNYENFNQKTSIQSYLSLIACFSIKNILIHLQHHTHLLFITMSKATFTSPYQSIQHAHFLQLF